MVLAALGHDLYEDSAISTAEIVAGYGPEVDALIRELTEEGGVTQYVEQVASGSEEARLIKFCDGVDNYGSLVETGLARSDPAWALRVVRQHMEPMFDRLLKISFRKYPAAGAWVTQALVTQRARFWDAVGEWSSP